MRTVALSLLTSAAFLLAPAMAQAAIAWQGNLRNAHVQAQAEGKLLLLHFYTDNCVWCERLEEGAFQSPEVAKAISERFVPVKVHAAENPKLAQMFQVTKFPTDVVVTTRGQTLSHRVSPQDAGRYVEMLGQAASAHTPPGATRVAAAASGPAGSAQSSPSAPAVNATTAGSRSSLPMSAGGTAPSQAPSPAANPYPAQTASSAPNAAVESAAAARRHPSKPGSFAGGATGRMAGARSEGMVLDRPGQSDFAAPETPVAETPEPANAAPQSPQPQAGSLADANKAAPADLSSESADEATPDLALQGFCPVSVIEEDRWVEGKAELGVIHLGKLYLFASEENREIFLADPIPYTPVLNEIDVVRFFEERRIVPGKREWGLKDPVHNRMFFFADEAAMEHFYVEHERYTDAAIEVMEQAVQDANPGT